ncbi:MAG: hypothetical protein JO347_06350 [Candidatus Eremiobacteraeota bacterium]|nr:hypothetical protein [Candidatus Eremiobacteraeota bacterium]
MTRRFACFTFCATLAMAALAVMADAPSVAGTSAQTPAPGVAFDQVDRTIPGNQSPPPPGSYAQELALAQRKASAPSPYGLHISIAETLANMALSYIPYAGPFASMAAAKAEQAQLKHERQEAQEAVAFGTLTHYAYYNGWTRIESGQYAFIRRPDLGKLYTLDLKNKAYIVSDLPQGAPVAATPSPGSAVESTLGWTTGGTLDLEGQTTTQYVAGDVMNITQSENGDCQQETISVDVTEYVAAAPDPTPLTSAALEQIAFPTGCVPAITHRESGTAPGDRMFVYRVIHIVGGSAMELEMPVLPIFGHTSGKQTPPPLSNGVWLLSERANIIAIQAGDDALFSPPADFTLAQRSGAQGAGH